MRRILICTGILGGGTALTFAAAAVAATLLPGGTVIPANPMVWERNFVKPGIELPAVPVTPDIMIDRPDQPWIEGDGLGEAAG